MVDHVIGAPRELSAFLQRAELHLAHVVRFLQLAHGDNTRTLYQLDFVLSDSARRTTGQLNLREVAEACDLAGMDGRDVGLRALERGFDWGDDALFPLLEERPEVLEIALGLRTINGLAVPEYWQREVHRHALQRLARMPSIPATLASAVLRLAFEERVADRPLAQQAAGRVDGWEAVALRALADPSQEIRAVAARWLGSARVAGAREALLEKVSTEKKERARVAMMEALEQLGEPLERFFDRPSLLDEAQAILRKTAPPAWLEVDSFPPLSWDDPPEPVAPAIVRAWLASAHKAKLPTPPPLLRMYARGLRGDDREGFATSLLAAWMAHDTAVPTHLDDEARAQLRKDAESYAQYLNVTPDEHYEQLVAGYLASPAVSAGSVPAVLVSEAYADLAEIAAAGVGFDADWQSKVAF